MTISLVTRPIRGHHADRTSNSSPHAIAATLRTYSLDEPALTREDVLASRGWDQRHHCYRRYRRTRTTRRA